MNTPISNPRFLPNHHTINIHRETAMIVFESGPIPEPQWVPRIHRYYLSENRGLAMDHGRVFGQGNGTRHALVAKSNPLGLIQIVEWRPELGHMAGTFYRIGPDFEVVPIYTEKRELSRGEIETILGSQRKDGSGPLTLNDEDLRLFFAASEPPWLHGIIRGQLAHWWIHHVELFFRFTAEDLDENQLRRCVEAAPYRALERWKNRLTSGQLKNCIRNSPRGSVCFATERIPSYLRTRHLDEFAADALTHASTKLTEGELLRLATTEPIAALKPACRPHLPPRLLARLLAGNLRRIRSEEMVEPLRNLERDIFASIAGFPAEWLVPHQGSFGTVMRSLDSSLKIRPRPADLIEMLDRMKPPYRQAFARCVASMI